MQLKKPQRVRSHILEEESLLAFKAALPDWKKGDISSNDYGKDGIVEITEKKSGFITNKEFYFQLKGTDSLKLNIRLKIATYNYLKESKIPALLVLYQSQTKKIFCKWIHNIFLPKKTGETITINLNPEDELNCSRIVQDLEELDLFRNDKKPLPYVFNVLLDAALEKFFSCGELAYLLNNAAEEIKGIIRFKNGNSNNRYVIHLSKKLISVTIAGLASNGLSIDVAKFLKGSDSNLEIFLVEILMLIGLSFVFEKKFYVASQLFIKLCKKSLLPTKNEKTEISKYIVFSLLESKNLIELIEIAEFFLKDKQILDLTSILILETISNLGSKSEEDICIVESYLQRVIKYFEELKKFELAAAFCCNLARLKFGRKSYREVFSYYALAKKFNPLFLKDPLFCSEVASVMYNTQHFIFAEKWYKKSLNFGIEEIEPINLCYYADCLIILGRYEEAFDFLSKFFSNPSSCKRQYPEYFLKKQSLGFIVNELNIKRQERKAQMARSLLFKKGCMENSDEELMKVINIDLLCADAWFNLALLQHKQGKIFDACISFLISSLWNPKDIESWTNAFVCTLSSSVHVYLLQYVFIAAYQRHGNIFMGSLVNYAKTHGGKIKNQMLDFFVGLSDLVPEINQQLIMKISEPT